MENPKDPKIQSIPFIDPELAALIPPLTDEEYAQLKDSIATHGFRPERGLILTWQGAIIDGHNRYQICRELETEGDTVILDMDKHFRELEHLKSKMDVYIWMLKNQLGRRNLSDAARIDVALKMEAVLREEARARQATSTGGSDPQLLMNSSEADKKPFLTRQKVAKIAGKSEQTVWKVKKIKDHADPDLLGAVMSGKKSIHAGYKEVRAREDAAKLMGAGATATSAPDTMTASSGNMTAASATATLDPIITYDPATTADTTVSMEQRLALIGAGLGDVLATIQAAPPAAAEREKYRNLLTQAQDILAKALRALDRH